MGFLSFIVLLAIAYLLWRISDQMPDVLFRLSEIQRDIAEIRRRSDPAPEPAQQTSADTTPSGAASEAGDTTGDE